MAFKKFVPFPRTTSTVAALLLFLLAFSITQTASEENEIRRCPKCWKYQTFRRADPPATTQCGDCLKPLRDALPPAARSFPIQTAPPETPAQERRRLQRIAEIRAADARGEKHPEDHGGIWALEGGKLKRIFHK